MHGCSDATIAPAFHTRFYRLAAHGITGVPYTALPACRHTEAGLTTGEPYTASLPNYPKPSTFFRANCTKPKL